MSFTGTTTLGKRGIRERGGAGPVGMLTHAARSLELTDEQKTKLDAAEKSLRGDDSSTRDEMKTLHTDLAADSRRRGYISAQGDALSRTHGHGYATLVLAEAYGMTMRADVREKLTKAVRLIVETQNDQGGWRYQLAAMGSYGADYHQRAVVAQNGLGANLKEDAVYPSTSADADGQALDGVHRYQLHFNKADLPPVRAFWSLTLYDKEGFQVANAQNRFAIGDRDEIADRVEDEPGGQHLPRPEMEKDRDQRDLLDEAEQQLCRIGGPSRLKPAAAADRRTAHRHFLHSPELVAFIWFGAAWVSRRISMAAGTGRNLFSHTMKLMAFG